MVLQRVWRSLFGKPRQRGQKAGQQPRRARLLLETLEDRCVPANLFVSSRFGADLVGDVAGRGGPTAPFASIQFAVNQAASGDRIHVAQGTYGYNPAVDQLSGFLRINPAAVMVFDKSLEIFGGFNDNYSILDPGRFRTTIDGGGAVRGVYVLAANLDINFSMSGFTIQAALAQAERNLPVGSGNDRIFGFGGGMWINNAGRANTGTPGTFALRDMIFFRNRAVGLDTSSLGAEPGQTAGAGGAAAGAGLDLRFVRNMVMERVNFTENLSQGGNGSGKGGDGLGGGFHTDNSNVTGNNLTFVGNRAVAGNGGSGRDAANTTGDGLGGAAAIQINSSTTLENVVAFNNSVRGGNANGEAGSGFGGAFFAEVATLNLTNANLRANTALGGDGGSGGLAGGGGIETLNSNLSLDRVQVIANTAQGGNGTGAAGSPGGGGLYLTRLNSNAPTTVNIVNTVVAENTVRFGNSGDTVVGGGGGGLWLQGVDATITQSTIAGNSFGPNLFYGQAMLLLNDGALTPTNVNLNFSIVANHTNNANPPAAAVHVRGQNGRNTLTYNRVLFANNTQDDNSNGQPADATGVGNINGRNTLLRAANAGFVSTGAPRFDYDLQSNSPAVGAAAGSQVTTDIDGNPRTGTPDLGAYEAGPAPTARDTVATYDPGSGLWQFRNSNSSGFPNLAMFAFGLGASRSIPVVGDWDGDGAAGIGVVEIIPSTTLPGNPLVLTWKLRNSLTPGAPDVGQFEYGRSIDIPVVGDWDGNGSFTVGIYEPDTGRWKLRNTNNPGAPDFNTPGESGFAFGGLAGTIPVVGDWDGNGSTTVGVAERFNSGVLTWKLRNSNSAGGADAGNFAYGGANFEPVTGDWDDNRQDSPGVFDPTGRWLLRNSNTPGGPDAGNFIFGQGLEIPLTGDFDRLP
ncbi:MAG: hypothetical protein IT429_07050 [Gemmataceae bacterium]|nr:hypothetical protein [Gemmataceae bacterium]